MANTKKVSLNSKLRAVDYNVLHYPSYVDKVTPKISHTLTLLKAYLTGGLICMVGQGIVDVFVNVFGVAKDDASGYASSLLILIAALLTGFGIYDNIAKFGGAGSTVPITGFSNAMVSPALEFRSEGLVYGLANKVFTVAGAVILNGVVISMIIGVIYWFIGGFNGG